MASAKELDAKTRKIAEKDGKISKIKGHWAGHQFIVSKKQIEGFVDLTIHSSSETEEKEKSKQKHISRKRGNPTEISFTVKLNAYAGCKVRTEATKFLTEARTGKTAFLYIGSEKLIPQQLMLTDATVQSVVISPGGTWVSADVALTFQQYDTGGTAVNDSGSGGGSGGSGSGGGGGSAGAGSKKISVNSSSPTATKNSGSLLTKIGNTLKAASTNPQYVKNLMAQKAAEAKNKATAAKIKQGIIQKNMKKQAQIKARTTQTTASHGKAIFGFAQHYGGGSNGSVSNR